MPKYRFVDFDEFTPDDPGWTAAGRVGSWELAGSALILTVQPVPPAAAPAARPGAGVPLRIEFLSPTLFRVRFNPEGDYRADVSYAAVDRAFGPRLRAGDPAARHRRSGGAVGRYRPDPGPDHQGPLRRGDELQPPLPPEASARGRPNTDHRRNIVERPINRLKPSRRIATRDEERSANSLAMLILGMILVWI